MESMKKLQIVVHLILVNLACPSNAMFFYGILLKIVAFDVLPVDDYYDEAFELQESEAINPTFDNIGYESMYYVRNLGSMFLTFLLIPIGVIVLWPLKLCFKNHKVLQRRQKFIDGVFWNGTILFFFENCMVLIVSASTNILLLLSVNTDVQMYSTGEFIQTWAGMLTLAVVLLLPFFVLGFFLINFTDKVQQREERFMSKYVALVADMHLERAGKLSLLHVLYQQLYRVGVSLSVVFLTSLPFWTLVVFNFGTLFSLIITG